ncbi:MAG TPA: N-acetyl-D-Glu racemase DgcA [Steroidobacteraceae bacterium]|nr:N-acetyl-D-Glu racemase DgcA [Steroidobacteraceae bacterium]
MHAAVTVERWAMKEVFATSRDAIDHIPVVLVTLTDESGCRGRGEAAGVDYDGETPASMVSQIAALGPALHEGLRHEELLGLLGAGGARNALDCALWDLNAKRSGVRVWQAAGLVAPRPVTSCLTIGLGDEADTRRRAREASGYELLKLKLDAERHLDLVRIVREEQPRARLLVDANQAWSRTLLEKLLPELAALDVELIEQPVRRGEDATLDGLRSSVPLAADESCTDRRSLRQLLGRYRCINIKLDKCGGLTEALALAAEATRLGFALMVGNMCGTSLAMAPAFLIAQACRYVDLDGPLLQREDREPRIAYDHGVMQVPDPALWG